MAWLIACFLDDQTVSMVSEKWPKKNLNKCYFPKTKIASKIKKETPVDKKSGEWTLHACRILMDGRKYATFKEAKEAEKIAQNHSTMSSFENSYAADREARKHPKVYNDSTATESDCEDAEKIKKLQQLDGSLSPSDKEYSYDISGSGNDVLSGNQSSDGEDDQSCDEGEDGQSWYADEENGSGGDDDNATSAASTDDEENGESDGEENDDNDGEDGDTDENFVEENNGNEVLDEEDAGDTVENSDEENAQSNDVFRKSIISYSDTNLESTSELRSPAEGYDFSDDRRIVRVEKLLMYACQELESIKSELKALKVQSDEIEKVVEKLVLVCKDLSVEVFACTAELKKRNGLFTDMLVPDLKLNIKRRKDFKSNELALENKKVSGNMIKYLASTINEMKEKDFIVGCFNAIFDIDFLTDKVWWKSERGKILMKKTRTLHCMKESFKEKFGLVEPRRKDKEIEALIHKICRNMKDNHRKGLKKARDIEEKAKNNDEEVVVSKTAKKAETKSRSDPVRESACESERKTSEKEIAATMEWEWEDYQNYKKHKKERRAAKKAEKRKEEEAIANDNDSKKQKRG